MPILNKKMLIDFWQNMAARMVDSQAPGLARRVRELGELASSGEGWQSRVLARAEVQALAAPGREGEEGRAGQREAQRIGLAGHGLQSTARYRFCRLYDIP